MKEILSGAALLQTMTIDSEQKQRESGVEYSDRHVRQATVHTRQDMILLAYHLSSIGQWCKRIFGTLLVLTLIAGANLVMSMT